MNGLSGDKLSQREVRLNLHNGRLGDRGKNRKWRLTYRKPKWSVGIQTRPHAQFELLLNT